MSCVGCAIPAILLFEKLTSPLALIVNPDVPEIVLPLRFMLSTSNAVSVPTLVRLEFTTPAPSVFAVSTLVPATLYSLPVVTSIFSVVVQLLVAFCQVHFLSAPVTLTTIPESSTPESVKSVLSFVIASSICLSSTLRLLTSILAEEP